MDKRKELSIMQNSSIIIGLEEKKRKCLLMITGYK
jgi:hypothetical protein